MFTAPLFAAVVAVVLTVAAAGASEPTLAEVSVVSVERVWCRQPHTSVWHRLRCVCVNVRPCCGIAVPCCRPVCRCVSLRAPVGRFGIAEVWRVCVCVVCLVCVWCVVLCVVCFGVRSGCYPFVANLAAHSCCLRRRTPNSWNQKSRARVDLPRRACLPVWTASHAPRGP